MIGFRRTRALGVVALALASPLFAQVTPASVGPEILADRTVTFRLRAPQAKSVVLHGNWTEVELPMKADAEGVWTATAGPLPPQVYTYSFETGGLTIPDPGNPWIVSGSWGRASLVEVPGDRPAPWTERPRIRHGAVATQSYLYRDKVRRCVVYTPPGYERGRGRYPVLYLLHSFGGNENDWTAAGPAHVIADNLVADGKAVPAIIVMPNSHGLAPQYGGGFDDVRNLRLFQEELLEHVIPMVESRYRVQADAAHRALAGPSMGAGHTLSVGLDHLERFAWLGAMGAGPKPPAPALDAKALNRRLRLLWIGCGRADTGFEDNRKYAEALTTAGIRHVWHEGAGGHNWLSWREYLAALLPQLFHR